MDKINWRQKLTSRKLWAAVGTFVVSLLAFFGVNEDVVIKVTALITASASMIAYIIGEGLVDAAYAEANTEKQKPPDADK